MLLVLLCAYICMGLSSPPIDEEQMYYGDYFSWWLPRKTEYLEYSSYYNEDKVVLWRRSDSAAGHESRGKMEGRHWVIEKLSQNDNGIYTIYTRDRQLIQAKRIEVSESYSSLHMMTGEKAIITFNLNRASCILAFIPEHSANPEDVVKHGYLDSESSFQERVKVREPDESSFDLLIFDLKISDTGRFELVDLEGLVAQVVNLEVLAPAPASFYIGIAVGIIAVVVICCCCVRKCCCKKSSSKPISSVAQTAAAPAVHYHDQNASQPAGPKYLGQTPAPTYPTQAPTYLNQSAGSSYPSGPSYSGPSYGFHSPLVHNPTDINVTYPQPEMPATAGQGAAPTLPIGYDSLSSDSGPRFELKGLAFPSAPPLSSDTSTCDIYTSNKLNFL